MTRPISTMSLLAYMNLNLRSFGSKNRERLCHTALAISYSSTFIRIWLRRSPTCWSWNGSLECNIVTDMRHADRDDEAKRLTTNYSFVRAKLEWVSCIIHLLCSPRLLLTSQARFYLLTLCINTDCGLLPSHDTPDHDLLFQQYIYCSFSIFPHEKVFQRKCTRNLWFRLHLYLISLSESCLSTIM